MEDYTKNKGSKKLGFLVFLVFLIVLALSWIAFALVYQNVLRSERLSVEQERLEIEKEQHIDNLYSIYKQNLLNCKKEAISSKKDETYIKENCIEPINNSIIANWLKNRGYEHLIKTE
ncbi:MAG: hypothetical protein ACOCUF_03785 [Patescibacteria group bacterium]